MAQVSELGDDVFGARTVECGVRNAGCGRRMSTQRPGSANCGVRPAGVCGAGRCTLRSRPMSAECGAGRCLRSAERGVLRSAEYGVLFNLGRQLYSGRQGWEWLN